MSLSRVKISTQSTQTHLIFYEVISVSIHLRQNKPVPVGL